MFFFKFIQITFGLCWKKMHYNLVQNSFAVFLFFCPRSIFCLYHLDNTKLHQNNIFFKNKQPVVFHSLIFLSPSKHILINQILFFHTGLNSASFIWVHSGKRPYQLKTVNDEVFILTFNINLKYSKCIFSIALPLKIPIFHWHSSIH